MASIPTEHQHLWKTLLGSANHHVAHGVVASNNQQRNRYWKHWQQFLPPHFSPYLQNLHQEEQVSVFQAFIEWVRQGHIGRGQQVKAGTVQDAIGAIGKTFELAGYVNPTYKPGTTNYHIRIDRQMEAFKRSDPPTRPQLAVPVEIPKWIYRTSRLSPRTNIRATGELCLIAFYFLLRVGEYTNNHATQQTRTQQLRLGDITFFHQQQPIPLSTLRTNPNLPDLVRLRIDNQKNGHRNQIMSHHAIPDPCCPIKALVARTLSLLNDEAPPDTPICAFRPQPSAPFQYITNDDIVQAVRTALPFNKTHAPGYLPKSVGSHSLRAGGAMALFLQGADATAIMKIGRWTSTAFMSYIHEQLDVVTKGAAQRMSEATSFVNLDVNTPPE